jgi:hypothetical protein
MLYLAVSQFAAVEHASRAKDVDQFGWHEAMARPRRFPSLWSPLRRGERLGWDVRSTYVLRPLESASL